MINNLFRLVSVLFGKQAPDPRLPPVSPSPSDRPSNEPEDSTPEVNNVTPDIQEEPMPYLRKSKRRIHSVIVHSTATKASMKVTVADIDRWHRERNPPFNQIGYHLVIYRDGTAHLGRDIDIQGAHAGGHNRGSIGVVMVGGLSDSHGPEANFTRAQLRTLSKVLDEQDGYYPNLQIIGHRDTKATACPSFDVKRWRETGEVIA